MRNRPLATRLVSGAAAAGALALVLTAGVRNDELTQEGYYDDVASGFHAAVTTGQGAAGARIMSYSLEGTATGARFVGWEDAQIVTYERLVSRGALTKAKATYKTNGAVDEGRIIRMWNNASATGKSNAYNQGASSVGGVGYLQYDSTGGSEGQIGVFHSSDDVTYAQLFPFACSTAAFGADRQVTTAVVEQYVKADYTTANVSGTTSFTFFVGFAFGISS